MPVNRRTTKRVRQDTQSGDSDTNTNQASQAQTSQAQNETEHKSATTRRSARTANRTAESSSSSSASTEVTPVSSPSTRGQRSTRATASRSAGSYSSLGDPRAAAEAAAAEGARIAQAHAAAVAAARAASEAAARAAAARVLPPRRARPANLVRRDTQDLRRSNRLQENQEERKESSTHQRRRGPRFFTTTIHLGTRRPRTFDHDDSDHNSSEEEDEHKESSLSGFPAQVFRLLFQSGIFGNRAHRESSLDDDDDESHGDDEDGDFNLFGVDGDEEAEFEFISDEDEDGDFEVLEISSDESNSDEEATHRTNPSGSVLESDSDEDVAVTDLTSLGAPRIELIGGSRSLSGTVSSQTESQPLENPFQSYLTGLPMSSTAASTPTSSPSSQVLVHKLKLLVRMLREGCGDSSCKNPDCASSAEFTRASNGEPLDERAAVRIAVGLLRSRVPLCPNLETELAAMTSSGKSGDTTKDKDSMSTSSSLGSPSTTTTACEPRTILNVFDAEAYAPLPSETVTYGQVWRLLASVQNAEERRQILASLDDTDASAATMTATGSSTDSSSTSPQNGTTMDVLGEGELDIAPEDDDEAPSNAATSPSPATSGSQLPSRTISAVEARVMRAFATPFLLGHAFKQARPSYARLCQMRLDLKPNDVLDTNRVEALIKSFDEGLANELAEQAKSDLAAAANPELNPGLTQRFLAPAKLGSFRRPAEQQDESKEGSDPKDGTSESKEAYNGPSPLQPAYVHAFVQLLKKIVEGENVVPDSSLKPYDWQSGAKAILQHKDSMKTESSSESKSSEQINAVIDALTRPIYGLNLLQGETNQNESVFSIYPPQKNLPSRLRDAYGNSEIMHSAPTYPFTSLTEAEVSAWIESEKDTTENGWAPFDCTPNHAGIDFVALEQLYNSIMNSPLASALSYAVRRSCQAVRRATSRNFPGVSDGEQKTNSGEASSTNRSTSGRSNEDYAESTGSSVTSTQGVNGGTLAGHFNGVNFYSPVTIHGLPCVTLTKQQAETHLTTKRACPNATPDPSTPRVPSLLIESVRYLRGLLILLEFPGFDDIHRLPSFNVLCRALHRASTSALKPVLCNWLSNYPIDRLRRIVGMLQHYSTLCWIQQDKLDAFKYPTNLLVLVRRIASVIENSMPLRRPANEFQRAIFQLHISKAFDAVTTSAPLYQLSPPLVEDETKEVSASEKSDASDEKSTKKQDIFRATEAPSRPWMPLRSVRFCERHIADQLANSLPEHNRYALLKGPTLRTEEFYNDAVNEDIDVKEDYRRARTSSYFSFWRRPFILDAATKSKFLQLHAQVQMQHSVRGRLFPGIDSYLILDVRRSNLIEDTLVILQEQPKENLKKPLRVRFSGEEGIDQGGVRKEFFQLITNELFDPKFGMFKAMSNRLWFSSNSLESDREFELIGMLLGLAIYNSVTLDLKLPPIVYSKLLKRRPTLEDFSISFPEEATALIDLLRFEGPETGPGSIEDIYATNFTVSHDNFGVSETVELKPGGENIPLTAANRGEYVELKIDWICNRSIAKQYQPFHRGFHSVAGSDVLEAFAPEELQLLVCGSERCDFHELEQGTRYDDGYTKDSRMMKWLWEILHELSLEDKKKFLFFCTGSDRVPISGLRELRLVISRHGPDSNILPTAHTCFNHLLLPDYSTKEKLRSMLLKAITHSQGFGLR